MTLKFIKKVTSEGKRKVINIPKKLNKEVEVGDDMLVEKLKKDYLEDLQK